MASKELSEHLTPAEYNREVLLGVPQGAKPSRAKRDDLESVFQARVVKIAEGYGWKVQFTKDSRKSPPGYPDLTMVRERGIHRLCWIECKREKGRVSDAQTEWHDTLSRLANHIELMAQRRIAEVFILRPSQLEMITDWLDT